MALEHNGDMYSCDHFVEPKYFLGNIKEKSMEKLASSEKQRKLARTSRALFQNIAVSARFIHLPR